MIIRRTAQSLKGKVFNSWTVISDIDPTSQRPRSLCRCTCGIEKYVEHSHLKAGKSKSCRKCSAKIVALTAIKTHGMSGTKVYRAWQSMKTRCYNENAESSYKYHGALGIKVHPDWLNSFEAFYAHIGEPPSKYHTIDRKDVFKNYEPGNVRWATMYEQMHNLREHYPQYYKSQSTPTTFNDFVRRLRNKAMPVTICIPTLSDDFKPISEEKLLAQFESARKQRENNTALVTHKFPDTNRAPMEVADFIKSYKKD